MTKLKLFLASSSELAEDRREFEIFIARENKILAKMNLFLELVIWEDFIDAMSKTRLQNKYNEVIKACDFFVLLFYSKVGKYTKEEFETAFGQFQETKKPLIYTYFKNSPIRIGDLNKEDMFSLWDFQDRLNQLGHFQTVYENTDALKYHFKHQFQKHLNTFEIEKGDNDKLVKSVIDVWSNINESNEQILLDLFYNTDKMTKENLCEESGFRKAKVNRIINRLAKKNLIFKEINEGTIYWKKT